MERTATILFNKDNDNWEAYVDNDLFIKSSRRKYVENQCVKRKSAKARELNVTSFVYADDAVTKKYLIQDGYFEVNAEDEEDGVEENTPTYDVDINTRFDYMEMMINMVCKKKVPSAIITGPGGLGKSYTVMETIRSNNLKDCLKEEEDSIPEDIDDGEEEKVVKLRKGDYIVIKGYSTAKALYCTLYDYRDKLIVFDDCDSIQKDGDALDILKAALDSYEERIIHWNSRGVFGDDYPRWFRFTGQIIFISNLSMSRMDQALKTRALRIDLSMTAQQKIDRMERILKEIMPRTSMKVKQDALGFIDKLKEEAKDLSFRTLIGVSKIREEYPSNWEGLAEYTIRS